MVTGYDWVDWVRVPPGAFKPLGVDERRLLEEAVEVLRARGRDVSGYSRMLQASIESLYETVTEMGKPPGVAEPTRLSKWLNLNRLYLKIRNQNREGDWCCVHWQFCC